MSTKLKIEVTDKFYFLMVPTNQSFSNSRL